MLDFTPFPRHGHGHVHVPAAPVLCLSNAFGSTREWDGITLCLGDRADCLGFTRTAQWQDTLDLSQGGAHLVAHGPRAYHALRLAASRPHAVRSLTLIDPDLISAFPELAPCTQFRAQARMIDRTVSAAAWGAHREAARTAVDWWMGRNAWTRTAPRLRDRFARAVPAMLADWRAQARAPLDIVDLGTLAPPVHLVTGARAPADIRSMVRLLRSVLAPATVTFVKGAGTAAHLTDPHLAAPEIRKFVVSCEAGWQDRTYLAQAA